jgi:general secretion pathway protein D
MIKKLTIILSLFLAVNTFALIKIDKNKASDKVTKLRILNADVMSVVETISKLTGKAFVISDNVKGKINIIANDELTRSELYAAFLAALDSTGLTVIPYGRYDKIVRRSDMRFSTTPYVNKQGIPPIDMFVTTVYRLKHVKVSEILGMIKGLKTTQGEVSAIPSTNALLITDNANNQRKIREIIEDLDKPGSTFGIYVIKLKYADSNNMSKMLTELFKTKNFSRKSNPEEISKITSYDPLNSLIVRANKSGYDNIMRMIKKLDSSRGAQSGIHILRLKNADAEKVAEILNNVISGSGGKKYFSYSGSSGKNIFDSSIKITADKYTNSLVILASSRDYNILKDKVVNGLDVPRKRIVCTAFIYEVSVNDMKDLGVRWYSGLPEMFGGKGGIRPIVGFPGPKTNSLTSMYTDPFSILNGGVLGSFIGPVIKPGKSGLPGKIGTGDKAINIATPISAAAVLLNSIQTWGKANLVTSHIVAGSDGEEAKMEMTQIIPKVGNVVLSGTSDTKTTIDVKEKEVPSHLIITPRVSEGGDRLTMNVEVLISDITDVGVPEEVKGKAFASTKRLAKTTIAVQNGVTALIGGLTRQAAEETEYKVPILGDIPLIGIFFRSTRKKKDKKNLLVFLTPRIINNEEDEFQVLSEALAMRKYMIERDFGGVDEFKTDLEKKVGFKKKKAI